MQNLRKKPDLIKWFQKKENYQRALQLCNCKALITNILNDDFLILSDDDANISFLFLFDHSLYLFTGFKAGKDENTQKEIFEPQENVGRYRLARIGNRKGLKNDGPGQEPSLYQSEHRNGSIIDI